eukprot:scaffold985_cov145-Skeletonema_menzelii.AAC.17
MVLSCPTSSFENEWEASCRAPPRSLSHSASFVSKLWGRRHVHLGRESAVWRAKYLKFQTSPSKQTP